MARHIVVNSYDNFRHLLVMETVWVPRIVLTLRHFWLLGSLQNHPFAKLGSQGGLVRMINERRSHKNKNIGKGIKNKEKSQKIKELLSLLLEYF